MPKSTSLCNSLVALLYNATPIANVADNAASSPLTLVYTSLHVSALTAGSSQTTNETAYTNYTRIGTARTTGGWTAASGGATQNVAAIDFPQCGVTGATITHAATGTTLASAGIVWHYGALNSSIAVSNQIQPRFPAGSLTITEA
jgi:hypothetical protein